MKNCKVKVNDSWQEVPFHGVFQYSDVIPPSPLVGGHKGGTIAYPVAVVELDNQLIMRNIDSVKDIKEVEEEKPQGKLRQQGLFEADEDETALPFDF